MIPSTKLKGISGQKLGFHLSNGVVAGGGESLYIKKKNPTEKLIYTAATQPLISSFLPCFSGEIWSSATLAENRSARNPSVMALPNVTTPRTTGHPIHLCFSDGRSRFSLCVAISPEGLRTAIAQA